MNQLVNIFLFSDNKRLDEWVTEDRLDTRKVQFPRRDGQMGGTGMSTPKKIGGSATGTLPANTSRPASPINSELVNGSAVLAAALQKKMNRKRKIIPVENEVRKLFIDKYSLYSVSSLLYQIVTTATIIIINIQVNSYL